MKKKLILILGCVTLLAACTTQTPSQLTDYVDPFLGTATLWKPEDLGYTRAIKERTWGGETFPGASLPYAMVQLSPVTQFRSGSGYQYEDQMIMGFTHTAKGHWYLNHIPLLPVTGHFDPSNFASGFSHENESAHPGYYQVFLERYNINAELTTTLRCGFHKYTFPQGAKKHVVADMTRSNSGVSNWEINKIDNNTFSGFQHAAGKMYFYAHTNYEISDVEQLKNDRREISVVNFLDTDSQEPLEMRIGFSFVSVENAKENLEAEMLDKTFTQVKDEANSVWEEILSKIEVEGGTEREKGLFYSSLYRSFLWPVLQSDVNGEFTDSQGNVKNEGFRYYSEPSFWDDYRNKLVLMGMISPDVTIDVMKSLIDNGEKKGGFMPTFFHGDHALPFFTGMYLRGLKDFDVERAYKLMFNNATVTEGNRIRPHMAEYLSKGYISEPDIKNVETHKVAHASVTKTQEYAYDDYSLALLAKELGKTDDYEMLMKRTGNYKNLFDPSTQFMRGRLADGSWIEDFDPYFPYYEYMYREANGWQSLFFAPHDSEGLVNLFPSHEAFELKLDSLFTIPWRGYEAHNMTGFIGQYCQGNQPNHGYPYMYYFIDKQEKSQAIIDTIMNHYYDMGADKLALSGMDDAGEMSSWYVFNAMGLYTYSPADPEYIVSVPLFDKVTFKLDDDTNFTITKKNQGKKIVNISYGGDKIDGWFITHDKLKEGKDLVITTE